MSNISLPKIRQSFQVFLKFNKYILRYWKLELGILILGNLSIVLSLLNPYIAKNVLDEGLLAKNKGTFIKYTLLGVGIYLMNLAISNLHRYIKNYVIRKVRLDLTKDIFKKIRKWPLRIFQNMSSGSYLFRVNFDITGVANIINDSFPSIITNSLKLIIITVIIVFINWRIMLLIMLYQLLVLLQIELFIKKTEKLMRSNLEKSENIFRKLNDFFSHIYIIKAFGTIAQEIKGYLHDFLERLRLEIKDTRLRIASETLSSVSDKLFFGIIGFYGSVLVIQGRLTLGSLGAVMAYISQGIAAYSALLNSAQQIILNRLILERIKTFSQIQPEENELEGTKNVSLKGKIEFRSVSFGYKKDELVLKNMSFCISPGEHVALVGHSGCGKTTIVNLILRLYEINKGALLLDDSDLRALTFKSIYSQIALAPQEHFLWDSSIKDNIVYAKKDFSFDELRQACQIAEIYDFIESLPNGIDSSVGENACWISQGQKQRIAIARAVIKKPKILILDEAMSSLDSETEDKIIDNIKREFEGSTVIVVSHRLSTARKMQRVYFLQDSQCMQIGTHDELLVKTAEYAQLFASQITSKPR